MKGVGVLKEQVAEVLNGAIATSLLQARMMRLGYNGTDGLPRVVPIGFLWKDNTIIVCTPLNAPKVAALRLHENVALEIDTATQPPHILFVRGVASIEEVEGVAPEFLAASKKYIPQEGFESFVEQSTFLYPQMARISITPQWAKVIDFDKTFPVAIEKAMKGSSS